MTRIGIPRRDDAPGVPEFEGNNPTGRRRPNRSAHTRPVAPARGSTATSSPPRPKLRFRRARFPDPGTGEKGDQTDPDRARAAIGHRQQRRALAGPRDRRGRRHMAPVSPAPAGLVLRPGPGEQMTDNVAAQTQIPFGLARRGPPATAPTATTSSDCHTTLTTLPPAACRRPPTSAARVGGSLPRGHQQRRRRWRLPGSGGSTGWSRAKLPNSRMSPQQADEWRPRDG